MTEQTALLKELNHRAARIRLLSMTSTSQAGSGHPTSCLSAADLLSVLFFRTMRYDPANPASNANDRLVMSKGHAAPALYAAWAEAGYLREEELLSLRTMNSRIEGHPMPSLPFVDVATGSLGQGLSVGLGIALQQARVLQNGARTYVLMGDGELAEGSVWEAMALAAQLKLDNLTALVDVNRLGQSRETMHGHDLLTYAKKIEAFGWEAFIVENGNDIEQLLPAFERAVRVQNKPACILAKTFKGAGVSFLADKNDWHGKPLKKGEELEKAIAEVSVHLMKSPPTPAIPRPSGPAGSPKRAPVSAPIDPPPYKQGQEVATRKAVGDALIALGKADPRIWVIDGDTQNSTYTQVFGTKFPDRFIECFIAEQNMAGIAAGLAARGLIPFSVTFGAFLARAFDQVRMAALSGLPVKFLGTHAGISIGEDGPSQMALEDLATFRTLPNGAVLYPSDAISAYGCIDALARHDGPGYVRLSRPATDLLYPTSETFPLGGMKIPHLGKNPRLTVVTAGVIVHEALEAVRKLPDPELVQVVDMYCLKPFPMAPLQAALAKSGGKCLVCEEHAPAGGLGEAVARHLAGNITFWKHLAVDGVPRSASPKELLHSFGLSAEALGKTIQTMLA